jgi:hypothetical protein
MSRTILPEPELLAIAVSGQDRLALANALNLLDDRRPAARKCAATFLDSLSNKKCWSFDWYYWTTGSWKILTNFCAH